jgi:RNA polymerase sigma-70 factor (ECF subfamily)
MPLSDVDRTLLDYCFRKRPFAWESFVDRFLTLVVFVVKHTAEIRRIQLVEHDEFDLVTDVFLALQRDDFAILRRFRGQCSLATYLTVVARRVVVRKLVRLNRPVSAPGLTAAVGVVDESAPLLSPAEIESLLPSLEPNEASLVRLYHLEGKTIEQISDETGVNSRSIRSILAEARAKLNRPFEVG